MPNIDHTSEVDRQRKYLASLTSDFTYPLFNSKHALESQRKSGYRTTAAAAREIVDNAIEAGASQVHVAIKEIETKGKRAKMQQKGSVTDVAFIDDGAMPMHSSSPASSTSIGQTRGEPSARSVPSSPSRCSPKLCSPFAASSGACSRNAAQFTGPS